MDEHEKRVDLNSELGMSRRDLLRRGAIVGGTLLWVAPAIQSVGAKAAWARGTSGQCGTCYCSWSRNGNFVLDACFNDGITGITASAESCENFCRDDTPNHHTPKGKPATSHTSSYTSCDAGHCQCILQSQGSPGVSCI